MRSPKGSPDEFLARLVGTYSPSGEEAEAVSVVVDEMNNLGYRVRIDSAGNAVGELGSGKPSVLLCGHVDTVPPMLPMHVDGEMLYGRGAVDAKAPLAAMVHAGAKAVVDGYSGRITVAAAVDEEGRSKGAKQLIADGVRADYAVFGEPTSTGTVTVGYKGSLSTEVTCTTETGHSSAPWMFESAVDMALRAYGAMRRIGGPQGDGGHFEEVTTCLRLIEGGQEGNVVPSRCRIQVDVRFPPPLMSTEVWDRIGAAVDGCRGEGAARIEARALDSSEPYLSPARTPITRALAHSIYRATGHPATLVRRTGTGDMCVYGPATGIPCVTYGPGDGHLDHTPAEHVSFSEYRKGIEVLRGALATLPGLHDATPH